MSASKDIQALVSTVGSKIDTLIGKVTALQETADALASEVSALKANVPDQSDLDAQAAATAELNSILAKLG